MPNDESSSHAQATYTNKRSLINRTSRIIGIFAVLLVALYTSMLFFLHRWGLTAATHNVILYEAELYMDAYAQKTCTPLPNTQSMVGFLGAETVSQRVKDVFPIEKWDTWPKASDGIMYNFQRSGSYDTHYHLLVNDLPGTDQKFILFYEITVSESTREKVLKKFKEYSVIGGLAVLVLIFLFKFFIAQAISPLKSLSSWMNRIDNNPPSDLPLDLKDDEIGQLGQELRTALWRIHESNEREKQFLRNASHELRTPISIIRNAMDVLEHKRQRGDDNIDPVLARIRRASDTMKSVTEAILWLAVDRYHAPEKTVVHLAELVDEVTEENREIFKDKAVKLNSHIENGFEIEIEAILLRIALDNMLRNAFQHCEDGEITLNCLSVGRIEIVNSMPVYEDSASKSDDTNSMMLTGGFGLGLSLVAKVAEKQGWQFSFVFEDGCAISRLVFHSQDD